jgi:predicted metal-dependent HD superfamily phosphohydrolase
VHLAEVLRALDEIASAGQLEVGQALLARTVGWFHDLHYDPRSAAGSNEQRSATMARDHLHALGVDDRLVDAVEAGVLMTAAHEVGPAGRHTSMLEAFHDADLWILSAPADRYAAYRSQVREEYAAVPDERFRTGRVEVLAGFAGRERIYRTEHAHLRWTARARVNLGAELRELSRGV